MSFSALYWRSPATSKSSNIRLQPRKGKRLSPFWIAPNRHNGARSREGQGFGRWRREVHFLCALKIHLGVTSNRRII